MVKKKLLLLIFIYPDYLCRAILKVSFLFLGHFHMFSFATSVIFLVTMTYYLAQAWAN